MQKGLMITLPRYDVVTEYLSSYSKDILTLAEKKGLKIFKLEENNVERTKFEEVLEKLDYNLIILNGHGDFNTVFGHKDLPLILKEKNSKILYKRITYACSCDAGSSLGNCVNESEGGCFIGYKFKFKFCIDKTRISSPQTDNVARLFLNPSNIIPKSLIKGNSATESCENSKKAILKAMKRIIQNKEPKPYLEVLWNNYQGLVLHGDGDSKID